MPSHTLTLDCGCTVYVACHPASGLAHSRILETHAPGCHLRRHERGTRLLLWELLPGPWHSAAVQFHGTDAATTDPGRVTSLC